MIALRSEKNSVWACALPGHALTSHKLLWLLPNLHLYEWASCQPDNDRASASHLALSVHPALDKNQAEIVVSPIQTEDFIISSVCHRCLPVGSLHRYQRGGGKPHVNCPIMSMLCMTQQKHGPISSTVHSLIAYFTIFYSSPMNIPSFLTSLSKKFGSFLPGPGARVQEWGVDQSLTCDSVKHTIVQAAL